MSDQIDNAIARAADGIVNHAAKRMADATVWAAAYNAHKADGSSAVQAADDAVRSWRDMEARLEAG